MKKIIICTVIGILLATGNWLRAQTFYNFTSSTSGLPDDYVIGGVAVDDNNNKWFGTASGVAKFDDANWTVYTTSDGLPDNYITCVAVDTANNIWVGTDGYGVCKYNGSTWTTFTTADGLCDNGIYFIACYYDGSIWFGSHGSGASKYDGTSWTTYTTGLPEDGGFLASILYIKFDNYGNTWFGTDRGASKFDGTNFTTYDTNAVSQMHDMYVTAIAVDDINTKWIGTLTHGITELNTSEVWVANHDTITSDIYSNHVQDIIFDHLGMMWTGMYVQYGALIVGGISKYNNYTDTWNSYTSDDGLVNEQVLRLAVDTNNYIWIATGAGISKLVDMTTVNEYGNPLLKVYPNPVNESINIEYPSDACLAQITDVSGKVICEQRISFSAKISTSDLQSGIYFIKLLDGEKVTYSKFVKE